MRDPSYISSVDNASRKLTRRFHIVHSRTMAILFRSINHVRLGFFLLHLDRLQVGLVSIERRLQARFQSGFRCAGSESASTADSTNVCSLQSSSALICTGLCERTATSPPPPDARN